MYVGAVRGSVVRRGKAWRVVVDTGRDPVSGRRRQITRTSKRDAHQELSRLLVEVGEGRHQGTGDLTLAMLCRQWLAHARASMEPNTAAELEGNMRRCFDA
ncbi:MAG TPA: hypothetical protein VF045_07000 [Acidimicrobiales bacterium]